MQRRDFIGAGSAMIALALISHSASAQADNSFSPSPPSPGDPLIIKNIAIGQGQPKVIVSTTAADSETVKTFVQAQAKTTDSSVIELRLDLLKNGKDAAAMVRLTQELYAMLPNKILLVTFRTQAEGGKQAIDDERYAALYRQLLSEGKLDLLDIEMYRPAPQVEQLIALAHRQGVRVILSSHDFKKTPSQAEIVSRLRQQQAMGADILKMAAMPNDPGDVIRMMSATLEMVQRYAKRPLLTMSMGGMGALSRLSGELTGSALTFGMAGSASAPGQLEARDLNQALALLHHALAESS
ncbi:type I 3-dehydroquinate dehydratase [Mixta sp. Marseille-Q2659]|uniref:type I 3-dehydroquinate dehydratase n=1 Tax=Mixta sp. Marseille-Q2659 TaxID=2736607 RepID=UPI0023B9404A|nr:type I 3-dehydroquinate dehydratase [Mixta sp. Marseille-Q2659]